MIDPDYKHVCYQLGIINMLGHLSCKLVIEIFLAEKTTISATHTADTVLIAESFKSKLFETRID